VKSNINNKRGSVTFTVDGVTHATLSYNRSLNVVSSIIVLDPSQQLGALPASAWPELWSAEKRLGHESEQLERAEWADGDPYPYPVAVRTYGYSILMPLVNAEGPNLYRATATAYGYSILMPLVNAE